MKRLVQVVIFLLPVLALGSLALAQQPDASALPSTPLVRILQAKGILTAQEAASVSAALSPEESEQRLARLLLAKGLISKPEYDETVAALGGSSPSIPTSAPRLVPAVARTAQPYPASSSLEARTPPADSLSTAGNPSRPVALNQGAAKPQEAKFIPAVAPLRVLPITVPKKEGLLPDLKLGSGARLRPYGFFKVSAAQQTTSHGGATFGSNDFPQGPLLLGDTGPNADPQFHIKDRQLRLGVDFEWPDVAPNLALTGKLEFDFEGNFTNVNNRNISSNRSSQPSLRLAWVRLDSKLGEVPWFMEFGQNWSIFGSSTLMDIFETTGFGFAQGNLYERMPMIRTGVQFGKGDFKFQPEFAIALASFGEPGLDADQRTRFGGRVGPEGNRPEYQTRFVFQYPLSRAPGVLPAQFIFSYDHATRAETVPGGNLPTGAIRTAFPDGVRLTSDRNAWSAEMQLPTPWVTLVGKYYRGGDLRYYFMGQFNDVFTDLRGATSLGTATSFSGRAIPFGCLGGTGAACTGGTVVASTLEPVMGQGGFVQLGFPLSRIFGASPEGRAGFGGWTFYLTYGVDSAFAKDTRRAAGAAAGLLRTDHGSVQLRYKINRWASFVHEETYLDTRTARPGLKLFRGVPSHMAHAWRSEFGTIFTF